jgi:hypothetical protein
MKTLRKILISLLLFAGIAVAVVWLVDPSRLHQVLGDKGRKFGYYEFAIEHYSRAIHLDGKRSGAHSTAEVLLVTTKASMTRPLKTMTEPLN